MSVCMPGLCTSPIKFPAQELTALSGFLWTSSAFIKSPKLINMAKKGSVEWNLWSQLGFQGNQQLCWQINYFQEKCFNAISSSSWAPGTFGTLRADNLRTWRWEEPLPPAIVPTQVPVPGTAREGGLGGRVARRSQHGRIWVVSGIRDVLCLLSPCEWWCWSFLGFKDPGGGGSHSELVKWSCLAFIVFFSLGVSAAGRWISGMGLCVLKGPSTSYDWLRTSLISPYTEGQETFPSSVLSPYLLWH